MAVRNGDIADADEVIALLGGMLNIPIGGVIAWFPNIPGVPELPDNFVTCDGQVLDNDESLLDGQTIPDLNNANMFLRGNGTAGTTGGEAEHTLTDDEMPIHDHVSGIPEAFNLYGTTAISTVDRRDGLQPTSTTPTTGPAGGDQPHNNLPPYTNVVWIMRIL